ncbi:MAG: ABC transporter substrate-binding protein [Rhodospirillales bacterium]
MSKFMDRFADRPADRPADRRARGVGRRTFMSRTLAAGTAAAALPAAAKKAQASPQRGGTFRIAISHGSTTDTLDPAGYEDGFLRLVGRTLFNNLTEVDEDNKLVPELAESWEASEGAMKWTFQIRKGVTFHNGKDLTAEDVVASINHHRGPDSQSGANPIVQPITDIKTDGKHTVVVTLAAGNADFPVMMSDYHLPIMPAVDGKADAASGVGTGGYRLRAFEPGVRFEAARSPDYWKAGRAHFDSVVMRSVHDPDARLKALQAGEADVIDRVPIHRVDALKRDKNLKIKETSGTGHYSIPMRTDTAPFDNNDVRLALKYALDREDMLQHVLRGHGAVGNDHPISRNYLYHNYDIPQRVYDPDRARFHLKKAGAEGLRVPLHAADTVFDGAIDAAALYKQHAAKAGITIDVVREPDDDYWSKVWMQKPWCFCYWTGRQTEDWMFTTAYAAGGSWNDSYWEHERFNQLLTAARTELDRAKREEIYYEMQVIVSDEGGVVVPMFNNYIFAARENVKHGQLSAAGDLDGDKCAERWWFA